MMTYQSYIYSVKTLLIASGIGGPLAHDDDHPTLVAQPEGAFELRLKSRGDDHAKTVVREVSLSGNAVGLSLVYWRWVSLFWGEGYISAGIYLYILYYT